ncbi:MAG: shikimate dehydrogenase, partial [Polyangiaceae bacterium]
IDVPKPADLTRMLGEIRTGLLAGANITLPHKREVMTLVDEVDETAQLVEAANVVSADANGRLKAYNTDLAAIEKEIADATTHRNRAVILGAGGGAAAAIAACKRLGFAMVGVTTRSWGDTESTFDSESAKRVRRLGGLATPWPSQARVVPSGKFSMAMRLQWSELAVQADIVIQATSAGMMGGDIGDDLTKLVPFDKLPKHAVALDLVYRPPLTPFLMQAEAAGLRAISGLGMLVRQAEATYRIWIGSDPAPGVMRRAAEIMLAGGPAPS